MSEHVEESSVLNIISGIIIELRKAETKHNFWPDDPMQAACIIAEEVGEACREACEIVYRGKTLNDFKKELEQTAAVCIRALAWIEEQRNVVGGR